MPSLFLISLIIPVFLSDKRSSLADLRFPVNLKKRSPAFFFRGGYLVQLCQPLLSFFPLPSFLPFTRHSWDFLAGASDSCLLDLTFCSPSTGFFYCVPQFSPQLFSPPREPSSFVLHRLPLLVELTNPRPNRTPSTSAIVPSPHTHSL